MNNEHRYTRNDILREYFEITFRDAFLSWYNDSKQFENKLYADDLEEDLDLGEAFMFLKAIDEFKEYYTYLHESKESLFT